MGGRIGGMILSKEIEDRVLSLPLQERARLADKLISSLEAVPDESWFIDLNSEIKSRAEAAQKGDVATVDGEQALERMWSLLA